MSEPWLSIIGVGEDGLDGLTSASRAALDAADIVFGGSRHLALVDAGRRGREWPVPFSIGPVLEVRGQRVAVLASGDPFWHGVGGSLTEHLSAGEWRAFHAPSTFSLAAARLGWRIEDTLCLGLHAAQFEKLLPHLSRGLQAICLLRDGDAAALLAAWLTTRGFGASRLWVLEALGGPQERVTEVRAAAFTATEVRAPVAVAMIAEGALGLQLSSGLPDDAFSHDGQITKQPVRAITLASLGPRAGERLWDIGAGSGAISIEWVLAGGPAATALAIESRTDRAERIRDNAQAFGVGDRVSVIEGEAPAVLADRPAPQAVFVGGGANEPMLQALWEMMPAGTRLVANAVTLETEAILVRWSAARGGSLLRIDLAEARPLGSLTGWVPSRPVVQWSVVR